MKTNPIDNFYFIILTLLALGCSFSENSNDLAKNSDSLKELPLVKNIEELNDDQKFQCYLSFLDAVFNQEPSECLQLQPIVIWDHDEFSNVYTDTQLAFNSYKRFR